MGKKQETVKENTFKSILLPVLVLLMICIVCGALLAWLNGVTKPLIVENEIKATQQAFLEVLPEGTDGESLESLTVATEGVESAVKSPDGLAAVKVSASGYSGKAVVVYVAFDGDGLISGIKIDASTQTSGIGSKVGAQDYADGFLSWDSKDQVSAGAPVDTISGASYSSKAVFEAVNRAILCYNNEIKGAE